MRFIKYIVCSLTLSSQLMAARTAQPIYVHPFDYGAGGTNLCLASHEAVLFSNPAIMPFGNKFFRWIGLKTLLVAAPQSFGVLLQAQGGGGGDDVIEQAVNSPIHLGAGGIFSFISNNFGFSVLGTIESDVKANRFGEFGLPEIRVQTDAYSGLQFGGGFQVNRWLSFGLGLKYLKAIEEDVRTAITDGDSAKEAINFNRISFGGMDAIGYDVGSLVFLQGAAADFRFALKMDDVGVTKNNSGESIFQPTYHTGMAVTLHTKSDMIHLEANYRDITDQYQEANFKKLYYGLKFTLENLIGISGGLHHGYPSFAVAVDFIILNFGASYYIKEMGDYQGEDPRQLVSFYLNMGI